MASGRHWKKKRRTPFDRQLSSYKEASECLTWTGADSSVGSTGGAYAFHKSTSSVGGDLPWGYRAHQRDEAREWPKAPELCRSASREHWGRTVFLAVSAQSQTLLIYLPPRWGPLGMMFSSLTAQTTL